MKKYTSQIFIILVFAILLTCSRGIVVMADNDPVESNPNISWNIDSDGVLTISGNGAMDDYDNDTVNYYGSTAPWAKYESKIVSVLISDGITHIGNKAFRECKKLKTVVIPNSVTSIGQESFFSCSSLTSIEIPNSVTIIGSSAFIGCSNLTSIEIPNSVTSIGQYTFSGCSGLTSIVIPNGVTSIESFAFSKCSGLTSIEIPNSVTSIGSYAFNVCSGLARIEIEDGVTSIGSYAFSNCSGLASIVIPNSVTSIGSSVFNNCSGLTSIVIPNSVTSIDYRLFFGCNNLTSIEIPDSVTSIGQESFSGCSSLTSIEIPNGVTSIESFAFSKCSGLTSIEIPNSVTSIGGAAFNGCNSLTSITIPFVGKTASSTGADALFGCIFGTASYTGGRSTKQYYSSSSYNTYYIPESLKEVTITGGSSIQYGAFYNCNTLTNIVIPDSVTSIGESAFSGCSGLKKITIPFVGKTAASTGTEAQFGYIFGRDPYTGGKATLQYYSSSSRCYYIPTELKEVTITSGDSLKYGAFYNCSGLTSNIIPNSVTEIGDAAFYNCSGLTSIEIPNSVTDIGESAFYNCSGLTSIVIPDSVTSIGKSAFYGCTGITSSVDGVLYSDDYKVLIACIADTESFVIPNSVTKILSSAFNGCSSLKSIEIPNSVTSIGISAFRGCSGLTSIEIPDGVTSIENSVFSGCSGLTSIEIPDSVISIGAESFKGCSRLGSVVIPNSVTSIGEGAFNGCSSINAVHIEDLPSWCRTSFASSSSNPVYYSQNIYIDGRFTTNLIIPDNVTSISNYAFYNCSSIKKITLPDSITDIGISAFSGCSSITSITIPSSVINIGDSAFSGCSGVTSIEIPDGITSIGNEVFSGCSGLTDIEIPNSVTSIGSSAFSGCSNLTSIEIPNSVTSIGESVFSGCSGLQKLTIPFVGKTVTSTGADALFGYIFGTTSYTGGRSTKQYYNSSSYNTYYIPSSLKDVTITSGSSIQYGAFYNCSSLTNIVIPDSVTSIGESAFSGCSGLADMVIPNSVTSIGGSVFSGCSGLQKLTMPFVGKSTASTGTEAVFGYIFGGASYSGGKSTKQYYSASSYSTYYIPSKLNEVTITGGNNIKYGAFYNCNSLKTITIPDGVATIGNYAFYDCSGLTSIDIPSEVTTIGAYEFAGCSNLQSVTIPDGVNDIEACAFDRCSNLKKVTIPSSVEFIGDAAFGNCSQISEVYYDGPESEWSSISIDSGNDYLSTATIHFNNCKYGHNMKEHVAKEATCSSEGNSEYWSCDGCDKYFSDADGENEIRADSWIIQKKAHEWNEGEVTTEPTCVTSGEKTLNCKNCDATKIETVDALGHNIKEHAAKEATCSSEGNSEYWSCDRCNKSFSDADGEHEIDADSWIIQKKAHEWNEGEVTTEPTCVTSGEKTLNCKNCDATKIETVDALGHNIKEHAAKEATCSSEGNSEYWSCDRCNKYFSDADGEHEIEANGWNIPATGHNYAKEFTTDKEPTCVEEGSKSRHCTNANCDSKTDVTTIPKKEHTYGAWSITQEATCTTDGSKEKSCSVCGNVIEESIPATGHNYDDDFTTDKEPTCVEEGSKSRHCTNANCDSKTDVTTIPKKEHIYGAWSITQEATCTTDGSKEKSCSVCGNVIKESIPATGHNYDEDFTLDKEPTCTAEGSKSKHCINVNCDSKKDVTAIPKKEHIYGAWSITQEATCTADGSKEKSCSACGNVIEESIPATGHNYAEEFTTDKEPTCTEEGLESRHCTNTNCDSVTDVKEMPAKGHSFGNWIEIVPSSCEDSGFEKHVCKVCGFAETQYLDPNGHQWEEEYSVDIEPTCTEDGSKSRHCANCDAVINSKVIPATGHTGNWETIKEPTCTQNGSKEMTCTACGYLIEMVIPAKGHSWNSEPTVDKAATCIDNGSQSIHCSRCDAIMDVATIPAAGHKWNTSYTVDVPATVTSAGSKSIHCSVCGAVKDGS